jgi:UDP-glucose 4-epimerase
MKCLVTGGAGFIGSHLSNELIKKGHTVAVVDNLSTGFEKNLNPQAIFYKADITDFGKTDDILLKEKPEIIFHLAAQIDVRKSDEDPVFDAQNNILASFNLIKTAHQAGAKKIIFASTGGAIYGDTENRPTPEGEKEWPLSPYGIAKLAVDKFLNYYHRTRGMNYISLRYGNVFGPRQNPHGEAGVVAIFINKMRENNQPIINGDGKQTRDYVYVDDVVEANMLALENFDKSGIYNVGTGRETDVNYLFQEINKHFGEKFKEEHGPPKQGEQKTSCLSFEKIKNVLGWEPKINFEEGIKKTIEEWDKLE